MEFSRRGPATDCAADSHRCPDPPPHGDVMLVMRDALLWQIYKDRLRHEIIMAELSKIERAMALRAASAHHTTPMPWDSMPQHSGPFFGWEHYGDVGEENDVKLPNNDRQSAESRFWKPVVEDLASKCWNPCKCRGNVGQQNSAFDEPKLQDSVETVPPSKTSPAVKWELTGITIPVKKPKPKPKPPMTWSCTVCQVQVNIENVVQKHCAGKMHRSNIATLESRIKAISGQKAKKGAEPSPGTDQVKTSSIRWSCSTCQANGTCQSDLEEHLEGKKHQQNIIASCKEGSNNHMVKNIAPDEAKSHKCNVPQHAEKKHLVGCSTCQVICGRESDLQIHLKGKRHLKKIRALLEESKNVAALRKEGSNNDMAKNISPHEAKSHESNVPQHAEKPPLVGCHICQFICGRELDLEIHLKGKRHLNKIRVLLEESKNMTMHSDSHKADLNLNSVPQHVEKTNCELDSESHLIDERHQLNVQSLDKKINQEKSNPPEIAKGQIPSSEWYCATCHAKCNSRAQFEHHCTNRKHQQKINVILGKGDIAKVSSLLIEVPCKEGSNNDMVKNIVSQEAKSHQRNVPEHAEKPPSVRSCSTCQGNCESDLDIHLMSKRIQDIVKKCRNMAMNSESQSVPQHVEETNCKLNWDHGLGDERLQLMNDRALREKINQDKNNPPEIAKVQIQSSEWDCTMCEAKCNSKAHFEHHCTSRKHQQKINVTLGEGDIAKVSSLHIEIPCKESKNELPSDGTAHQQNIAASCKEGSKSDMAKNTEPHEANLHESSVPQYAAKPPLVGCSICQVMCGRKSDLEIHLKGKRHIKKTRALLEESENKAMDSESQKANLNPDSVPQPAEITNRELDLESYLGEERLHLMNDPALQEKINQDKNNPLEIPKDQIPSSEWDCAICQAKCNSRVQFENHCISRKHQLKAQVILGEGDIAKTGCLETG